MRLVCRPLRPDRFRGYGEVVSTEGAGPGLPVNDGRARRFSDLAGFEFDVAARPALSIYRVNPSVLPFPVSTLERHPGSTQLFMPVAVRRYLVVVSDMRSDGTPDPASLAAFVGTSGQGIHYGRGVWHHPIVALDGPAEFLMLMWERGDARDCLTCRLPETAEAVL